MYGRRFQIERGNSQPTYLLLRVSSRSGPLCNDIFPCLRVGCKCICDAREGRTEIDAHDQLRFTSPSSLQLVTAHRILGSCGRDASVGGSMRLVSTITWWLMSSRH